MNVGYMRLIGGIFSTRLTWVAFTVVTLLYLSLHVPLLDNVPQIAIDESDFAFYISHAYGFNGHSNLPVIKELEYAIFFSYPFLSSLWHEIYEFSLISVRSLSVLFGVIALFGIYCLAKEYSLSTGSFGLVVWVLFLSNPFYIIFRWGRPDALIACLLIWSILFYLWSTKKHDFGSKMGFAFCSMFCAFVHPIGTLLALLVWLYYLLNSTKEGIIKMVLPFSTGLMFVIILFVANARMISSEVTYSEIWPHILNLTNKDRIATSLSGVWRTLEVYSMGYKRLYLLLFECLTLCVGLFYLRRCRAIFFFSFIGVLFLVVGFLMLNIQRNDFSLIVIPVALIVGFTHQRMRVGEQSWRKATWNILLSIYLVYSAAGTAFLIWSNSNNSSYQNLSRTLDALVPDNKTVFTLSQFWFPFSKNVTYHPEFDISRSKYDSVDALLENENFDFIVYSDFLRNNISPTTGQKSLIYGEAGHPVITKLNEITSAPGNGEVIASIPTNGFSTILVWRSY